ncbi:MAG: hypothetical protein AAF488_19310, partial [Planctomycetota bacterium]
VSFTFGDIELAPGERVVVVENRDAFIIRYGLDPQIAGQYSGKLSNAGEMLVLTDSRGRDVARFEYSDAWYPETDGEGKSLELRGVDEDPEEAASWDPSVEDQGSPGA